MEKISEGFKGEKIIRTPKRIWQLNAANPICKQLFITDIGYYPHAKYHFYARPKGRCENVLLYCVNGQGWIEFNSAVYTLESNMAFIIPANHAHLYRASDINPWSIYWFHFCGENTAIFDSIFGQIIHVEDLNHSRYDDRIQLFEEMFQNLERGYSPENLEYVSFCLMHFMASLKYINQFNEIKNTNEFDDAIQKSILFMKKNLENKITLEDIAHYAGYSTAHFGKLFAKKISFPPMEYYMKQKIQRSCYYLQFLDLKIKEIAFRLGFSDQFHFSREFKKEMGITPKEYKKWYSETHGQ